jgi:holliday junction DNA helicase RuvA
MAVPRIQGIEGRIPRAEESEIKRNFAIIVLLFRYCFGIALVLVGRKKKIQSPDTIFPLFTFMWFEGFKGGKFAIYTVSYIIFDTQIYMIAYLEGKFSYKNPAVVYVDVNGVGYEVNISLNTYSHIQKLKEGKLFTYLQVKEDAHNLYGFYDTYEKELFVMLIGISGIGAATARMMLSSMKPDEVSRAIVRGDVKMLESVKGIGKKTAERVVLELKDKLGKQPLGNEQPTMGGGHWEISNDAINALTALGIAKPVAEQAVKKVLTADPQMEQLEDIIKGALKAI